MARVKLFKMDVTRKSKGREVLCYAESIEAARAHVAAEAQVMVTADPKAIRSADRVVVPGQGALPDCMRQLALSGALDTVIYAAREKPFLGLCIGNNILDGTNSPP